ncbi:hypothetical protein DSO57_1014620 [Entomophthora muscae]|uniref:Uncharacterized protein n=1 Tax=Entomophthora muscae TaxID=34485 RepID=A0ACC2USI7_9FUNG|nr:hypothetical protein DSO57_1014620 [Entomophthora muscae]
MTCLWKTLFNVQYVSNLWIMLPRCSLDIDKGIYKAKPAENLRRSISCFDCNQLSITKLDLLYHKCGKCGSYSTKVLDTFNMNYSINIERYDINKDAGARNVRSNKKVAADQVSLVTLIDQMERYDLNESEDYDDAYSQFTCSCLSKGFTEYDSDFSASTRSSCYCGKSSDWSSNES